MSVKTPVSIDVIKEISYFCQRNWSQAEEWPISTIFSIENNAAFAVLTANRTQAETGGTSAQKAIG